MKRALIFFGGWDGHQPEVVAGRLASALETRGIRADRFGTLDVLDGDLASHDVIVPCWTMGELSGSRTQNLVAAVRSGVGLAGIHGGAGDAFRGNVDYEWMLGGHFVAHPHVGDYIVRTRPHALTAGLPAEFPYRSEQYYLLVDPANEVLAETDYLYEGKSCVMPVAWTKAWGDGRVFYSSLGHDPAEFDQFPASFELALRGIVWAAGL